MEFNELENVQNEVATKKAPDKKAKKNNKKPLLIMIGASLIVILIVLLVFFIVGLIKGNEGKKLADDLRGELGKSIEMAEKNTGTVIKLDSQNVMLKDIIDYDRICESDSTVKVGGVEVPEWAVFISLDGNDKISSVTYYDFKSLKKNWKGVKVSEPIDNTTIAYNMTKKEADKIISLAPLSVTYSNDDTATYLYKYYYLDENGNEQVYRLSVTYSLEDSVRGISTTEIDYMKFIFA